MEGRAAAPSPPVANRASRSSRVKSKCVKIVEGAPPWATRSQQTEARPRSTTSDGLRSRPHHITSIRYSNHVRSGERWGLGQVVGRHCQQAAVWILSVVGVLCLGVAAGKELGQRDVTDRVVRYASPSTGDEERPGLRAELAQADRLLLKRAILDQLRDEVSRSRAIELAQVLAVPNLFSYLVKFMGTSDERRIVDLALNTQDKGAVAFLLKRWKTLGTGSASYEFIKKGLLRYHLRSIPDMGLLRPFLSQKEQLKRQDAARVAAFQLNVVATNARQVLAVWADAMKQLKHDSTKFPYKGKDLLRLYSSESTGVRRINTNCRVGPGPGRLVLKPLPNELQSGDWSVRVRLRIKSGTGGRAVIETGGRHVWAANFKDEEWFTQEQFGAEDFVPGKLGRWTEIEFRWKEDGGERTRLERLVTVLVDGKVLLSSGVMNGEITSLYFDSGDGELVVANVEYRAQ